MASSSMVMPLFAKILVDVKIKLRLACDGVFSFLLDGQLNNKTCAMGVFVFHTDGAVVIGDNCIHDCQAEARPGFFG
jgi:hypothetical protein